MSERPIIKVDKDGKIRQTGKTRLKDGTIRVQPEGGMKFIPNKNEGGSVGDKLREEFSKLSRVKGKTGGTISVEEMDKIMRKVGIESGVFEKPVNKKDGGLMEAIDKVKAKEMKTGGEATPKPKTVKQAIVDKVRERAKASVVKGSKGPKLTKTGKQIVQSVEKDFPELFKRATKMETGGEAVPKKFKGFSKLPEAVQEKMDPTLAKKFEKGGPVKMGSGGGVCRGMGAARAGGKFKLR